MVIYQILVEYINNRFSSTAKIKIILKILKNIPPSSTGLLFWVQRF